MSLSHFIQIGHKLEIKKRKFDAWCGRTATPCIKFQFLTLFFPGAEIPGGEGLAQLPAVVHAEFGQKVVHVGLDRLLRNAQAGGDLAVGVIEAN